MKLTLIDLTQLVLSVEGHFSTTNADSDIEIEIVTWSRSLEQREHNFLAGWGSTACLRWLGISKWCWSSAGGKGLPATLWCWPSGGRLSTCPIAEISESKLERTSSKWPLRGLVEALASGQNSLSEYALASLDTTCSPEVLSLMHWLSGFRLVLWIRFWLYWSLMD